MADLLTQSEDVWRDYVLANIPSSGENDPVKADIRALMAGIIGGLNAVQLAAAVDVKYLTKAAMTADTSQADGAFALVYGDSTAANNGFYYWNDGGSVWVDAGAGIAASVVQNVSSLLTRMTAAESDIDTNATNISSKEPSANKTTAWSGTPGDTKFPTEKLVKDTINAAIASLTTADTNLQTNITNEVNARTAAVAGVSSDLADEVTRATTAEDGINNTVSNLGILIGNELPAGVLFAGVDDTPQGNTFFYVTDDSLFTWHSPYFDKLSATADAFVPIELPTNMLAAFTDGTEQGNAFAWIMNDEDFTWRSPFFDKIGQNINKALEATGGAWDKLNVSGKDTLIASIWYGQSRSVGANGGPAISTTPLDYAWSYSKVRTAPASGVTAIDRSALVALVESDDTYGGGRGETGASGAAMMLKQLLTADGVDLGDNGQYLFFSAPGFGGQSAVNLAPGTTYFTSLVSDIEGAVPLAAANDMFYTALNMDLLQGEADALTHPQSWANTIEKIRKTAEDAAIAAQGFNRPLPVILDQMNANVQYLNDTPALALKQLELALTDDNYAMACPSYIFPRSSAPHFTPEGYRWSGAYFGLAKYMWFWKGIKPKVLYPLPFRKQGKRILQPFSVPVGNLQTYTSAAVPSQTNYGVEYVNSAGDPLTIVSIQIVGKSLVVEFDANVPDGVTGRFGWNGSDTQPGMTNLRDEQDIVFTAPDTTTYTLYNHLVQSISTEEQ